MNISFPRCELRAIAMPLREGVVVIPKNGVIVDGTVI
jgi:hypothetical protein